MAAKAPDKGEPPKPNRPIVIVSGAKVDEIVPGKVTSEQVGLKALGLLRLPDAWVPPFFVVSGTRAASPAAIRKAAKQAGISLNDEVWVRSSGSREGMEERGALESERSSVNSVSNTIRSLQSNPVLVAQRGQQLVHFVVQKRVPVKKKGHLANVRRLQRHPRDWTYEVEGSDGASQSIGVRRWRDASSRDARSLRCEAFVLIPHALRSVAAWVSPYRAHLEWVWDGEAVWLVQLDFLSDSNAGVNPDSLVSVTPRPHFPASDLLVFRPATIESAGPYPKLNNIRLYSKLGYKMPCFYVLSNPTEIHSLIANGVVSRSLRSDLSKLCAHPFVLRTDADGLAPDKRQMLPRSDELRNPKAAAAWLLGPFREMMKSLGDAREVVLIGHHFIPAVASAWCQATPDDRRVRIESLWGIPEGLYCFAHDVFDVDTMYATLEGHDSSDAQILMRRERYKGKFVAPNEAGEWKVHETTPGPDWTRSIKRDAWVKEIAWTSRRIAAQVGGPIVVMWFVGVHESQKLQPVMPWHHEAWIPTPGGYKKAAPRTKRASAQIREVASKQDWDALVHDVENDALVERVVIDPKDETIIRSRKFVGELAQHAKEHDYVVELSGGLLSHFYYMLSKEGCKVECVDLFGVMEEAIEFNKLVRDKIPNEIEQRGENVDVLRLVGDALIVALKRKLVEESFEVLEATTIDGMADEIADLSEVIDALVQVLKLTEKSVEDRKAKKRDRRGGFAEGLMLVKTSLPAPLRGAMVAHEKLQQRRPIKDVNELPRHDADFHIDHRRDASGAPERQITMTLSAFDENYSAGQHGFNLATQHGKPHDIFFNARVERVGSTLKLRVRLTNSALQLSFPFENSESGLEGED